MALWGYKKFMVILKNSSIVYLAHGGQMYSSKIKLLEEFDFIEN